MDEFGGDWGQLTSGSSGKRFRLLLSQERGDAAGKVLDGPRRRSEVRTSAWGNTASWSSRLPSTLAHQRQTDSLGSRVLSWKLRARRGERSVCG